MDLLYYFGGYQNWIASKVESDYIDVQETTLSALKTQAQHYAQSLS